MSLLLLTEPRKAVELFSLPVSLSVLESLTVGLLSKWVSSNISLLKVCIALASKEL